LPGAGGGTAGVQEPSLGAGGIRVKELEEFPLQRPKAEEAVFSDAECAEVYHGAKESKVGLGVAGPAKAGELESVLEADDHHRQQIQRLGDVGEGFAGSGGAGNYLVGGHAE
jgi:hypothetical protein